MPRRKKPPLAAGGGSTQRRHVLASIDLHGYRKLEALSRLTEFLDQTTRRYNNGSGTCWVEVITGSGSHSQEGPVLRPAVLALFEKRQMTWLAKGTGNACFLVNAASGIVLYDAEAPKDSKVLVADSSAKLKIGNGRWGSLPAANIVQESPSEFEGENIAILESTKAIKKEFVKNQKEARVLKRAMSMSKGDAEKEQREREEEETLVKRALSLSMLDSQQENELDNDFQKVIEESKQEAEKQRRDEEAILQAIEISREEHELYGGQSGMTEEELLQKAMELSQQECQSKRDMGAELLGAMERSRMQGQEADQEDADLLRVLEQSVLDF